MHNIRWLPSALIPDARAKAHHMINTHYKRQIIYWYIRIYQCFLSHEPKDQKSGPFVIITHSSEFGFELEFD